MEYKTTGLNILIVEDNPGDFVLIADYLNDVFKNLEITQAKSFGEAQTAISAISPDVVLLDLSLPDISGERLLEEMRPICEHIPMIVLTGFSNKKFAYTSLSHGALDYLLKDEMSPSALFKSITYCIERHKINKRLRQSEENYRLLFRTGPMPKFIYDVETLRILDVNEAALRSYGYGREEFTGKSIRDLRPEEDLAKFEQWLVQTDRSGYLEVQSRHLKKNGQIIDVSLHSNSIDYDGRKARVVLSEDITQRLNAEKAISSSEQRFRKLVQESGDLITIMDRDAVFTYVSPNHLGILGYEYEFLLGKKLLDFVHGDDREHMLAFHEQLLHESRIYSSAFRLRHANGSYLWFEAIGTNALDDENVRGLVLNSRDVTSRVENEKHIREINDKLTVIATATSDAIYEFDYGSKMISLVGSNHQSLLGYEFTSQSISDEFFKSHLHPDDREKTLKILRAAPANKKKTHFELEYRFQRKNGSYADILDRFDIIRSKDGDVKKVGAMQDISSRKLQQTLLSLEKQIYELNANPKIDFEQVLDQMARNIESLIAGSKVAILFIDSQLAVKHIAGSSLPEAYRNAWDGVRIDSEDGGYGPELLEGRVVICEDLASDPAWKDYRDLAIENGLHAKWTVPVRKTSGKIIACISLYYQTKKAPTPEEIDVVERVAGLISVLIENRHSFEETERAKERYDIVAKATSDTIWDWNILEDKFEWNKGIQGVFGYKKNDVGKTSRWWFDRIHPEDSIKMSVKLYSFLEQKTEKWQDEYRFACADGSYKYVYDRAFLVKDENGRAIRMIGAMQDVTRQKQEEHRLKLLETVITQMKDSVIISEADKSGNTIPKIVFVNPAFTAMSGYKASEVIGKLPTLFMNRKPMKKELTRLLHALKNKQEFRFEALNRQKNGEQYWANVSIIPITNSEGEHSHWISIQRDITEEKRQEVEKEQLIRELTQNNKDLKQFSYITSHNLRAPLSNLTGLLNLMEEMPIENPELREIINGFHKSTHLLNETISDLVRVVIIKDNPSIQKEEVLIKDVFENVFHQLSFMISMYKPIINLKLEKVSILNINKAYLESILLNLLTNAIKYRSPDRKLRIFVSSRIVGDSIVLVFRDNGIGIDMERNREKIFGLYQRFHNYPDSKGLGLYLVKSQVESMGGTISVESTVDKGTTFTLTFKKQTNT